MNVDRRRPTFDHGRDIGPCSWVVEALSVIVLIGIVIAAATIVAELAARWPA